MDQKVNFKCKSVFAVRDTRIHAKVNKGEKALQVKLINESPLPDTVISCKINYFQAYNIPVYVDYVSCAHFNTPCVPCVPRTPESPYIKMRKFSFSFHRPMDD